MEAISISDFRKNMAHYLDSIRNRNKTLILGKRNKPEFVVIPVLSEEDREMYNSQNFWQELDEARKQKSISRNDAMALLDNNS